LNSTLSKNGQFRVVGLISAVTMSPKVGQRYGPVPTGLRLAGASRDLPPDQELERVAVARSRPRCKSVENGVRRLKLNFTV
jgi:hypothetical protein